jgi:hypothetical protein
MSEIQEYIDELSIMMSELRIDGCNRKATAIRNGIIALREKDKRKKGCEMCKFDIPMIFDSFTGMDGKPVNFCPNCGRDLRKPVKK